MIDEVEIRRVRNGFVVYSSNGAATPEGRTWVASSLKDICCVLEAIETGRATQSASAGRPTHWDDGEGSSA